MAEQSKDPVNREERVNAVLAAYLDAAAAGKAPDRAELLARHPDLAAELASFFAEDAQVRQLAEPLRPAAPAVPGVEAPTMPPGEPAADPLLGVVRYFGDYELVEEVARGGMGVVYKARQCSLDRVVALKMILAGQLAGEAEVQRFRQEAQTAARLQHPGIVALHEVGEHHSQHFFSMDFIEGKSLAEMVREHPLPAQQAIRYVRLVADAVHFAHEHGVLHRDLKPSNVLVDRFDAPRVTDFGLAKNIQKDAGLTDTGAVLGTPSYMPPEQASGQRGKVGPASDVYALGAVLYELVTGRPPFRAATTLDTLLQVLYDEPASPRLLNPAISRDLETVILKCLHKEPAKRYASARELGEDLGAVLEGRPIKARRASLPERLGVWLAQQGRSFKIAAATMGVAALVLLATFLILDWRQHTRMGGVQFKTDGEAQLAELFEEDGIELAVPPFTAPTRQPIRLPEGSYHVRLSAPYRLSETLPVQVVRDSLADWPQTIHADLSKRLLGEPLPSTGVFEFLPRGKGHDVLTVVREDTVALYDGGAGELRWRTKLGADDRPAPGAGEERQSSFFSTLLNINCSETEGLMAAQHAPRLLLPWRDLDGDKVPDPVWANFTGSALLALSGKDGKFLWLFRTVPMLPPGFDAARLAERLAWVRGRFVSLPSPGAGDRALILGLFTVSYLTNRWGAEPVPNVRWAEGVDARTGRSLWRQRLDNAWFSGEEDRWDSMPQLRGPWVLTMAGQEVLVGAAGSRLVGLNPRTGEPAPGWEEPVDLGFVPAGIPAFADLDGDGRIDMVLRDQKKQTVRALTLPAGKVLWEHALPEQTGWVGSNPGSGFLRDPLPVNLNDNGKAEVIVPGERGSIAVLDGISGRVRWRSTVAINHGSPSAARVLIGPDLDGDDWRDVLVANVVARRSGYGVYFRPLVRVQALSGQTGKALWRNRFGIADDKGYIETGVGAPLIAWQRGQDGWPMLVVPGKPHTLVVEGGTGKAAHIIESLRGPYRAIDLDGDGVPELIGYHFPHDGHGLLPGRLHRFRGTPAAAAGRPIAPQEEPVEWVRLPWISKVTPEDRGDYPMLALALVFLGYTGLRVIRKGWSGLWFPAIAYLVLVVGMTVFYLVLYRDDREPWQRYNWDGWYWILFIALFVGGMLTLWWLGIVGVFRLLRWVFRLAASRVWPGLSRDAKPR